MGHKLARKCPDDGQTAACGAFGPCAYMLPLLLSLPPCPRLSWAGTPHAAAPKLQIVCVAAETRQFRTARLARGLETQQIVCAHDITEIFR